jgi:hypothetical protein
MTQTSQITIENIIQGCRLGGCSLSQYLATIGGSSIPRQQAEAELIIAELKRRKEAAA